MIADRELAAVIAAIGRPPGDDVPAAEVARAALAALLAMGPTLARLRSLSTMFSSERLDNAIAALHECATTWTEAAERAHHRSRRA